MARTSQAQSVARERAAIRGIQKRLQGMTFIILGVPYSAETLEALFQGHIDAVAATASLRAQVAGAVKTAHDLTARLHPIFLALQTILRIQLNNAPDALADFGMVPRKIARRSAATNLIAAVRGKATRVERRTMGKAQKLKIKGTVTPEELAAAVAEVVAAALPDE
jgi:hypothetical protein